MFKERSLFKHKAGIIMNYIVLDLEWNQSARGKEYSVEEFPFEIIEIGAVKLDKKFNIIDEWESTIKPKVYTKLQRNVRAVLSITEEELNRGGDFEIEILKFLEWCGDDYMFATWGSMDITELRRNMNYYGVPETFSWPLLYLDLQKLYSINFSDGKSRVSLKTAIEEQGIEELEEYHSAISDARYTASLLKCLDFERVKRFLSIDTYRIPENRRDEIYLNFGTYEKYISKGFATREKAAMDRTVRACKCYICGKSMERTVKWFATNSKVYYGLFTCEEHGLIKGRFRVKQNFNGRFYAIRIMKKTDENGALSIYERQIKEREHRRKRRQAERKESE